MNTAQLRTDAESIFRAGVAAADPTEAVRRALEISPAGGAIIAREPVRPPHQVRVVAFGKAACTMARAAASVLAEEVFPGPGVAVVNRENRTGVDRFVVYGAGHPLPDRSGEIAARQLADYVRRSGPGDGVIVLVSGGGSALLPSPAPPVTLAEKITVTELLLASGAGIHELNTVRKHLSLLKGGGLAKAAAPARVETLILSDVIGDDLSAIASGPTVPDPTTFAEAVAVLKRRAVWDRLPATARSRFEQGLRGAVEDTPKPGDPIFSAARNRLVGSNRMSLEAAEEHARSLNYEVVRLSDSLTGEARDAAPMFHGLLKKAPARRTAVLAGGETTVTIRGNGKGGRNQEMALAMALQAREAKLAGGWVFLSAGTDGRDGPTDAAGGLVDAGTVRRAVAGGIDPEAALQRNDSYHALAASGDLLLTGGTGTNVADLQVMLVDAGGG